MQSQYYVPVDTEENQDGRRRILSVEGVPTGSRYAWLTFIDEVDGKYRVPLGKVSSCAIDTDKSEWDTVLIPLYPMRFTTFFESEKANRAHAEQVRPGWIYIYKNGYFWREIQVLERGFLRDVNISVYQGLDVRQANVERDNRMLVPYKVNGEVYSIQICYSEVQWGWDRINALGGMDPKDPRLLAGTPMPSGSKSSAAGLRIKRMGNVLDFSSYKQGFQVDTGPLGPIDETKCWSARLHHGTVIPAVYLHDPIGIARALKEDHVASALEVEILSEKMKEGEYPLALLIKDLLDASQKRLGEASRNGEQYENVFEYELFNSVNTGKLAERIEYWQNLDKDLSKQLYEDGKRILQYITDKSQPLNFHTALLDYLENNTEKRFADGAATWCGIIEYFYFEQARKYIGEVASGGHEIGKYLTAPTKQQAKFLIALEQDKSIEDGLFPNLILDAKEDSVRASKYGTKVFRYMVKGFALAKLGEPGKAGLQWLIDFIQVYLPEFEASVKEISLSALYMAKGVPNSHFYRYLPALKVTQVTGKPFLVPIILPKGIDLPKKTDQIQKQWLYRKGFMGLWGALETINFAMAAGKAFETNDGRAWAKAGVALSDIAGYVATITDMATEGARKLLALKLANANQILANAKQRALTVPSYNNWARTDRLKDICKSIGVSKSKLELAGKASRFLGLVSAAGNTAIGAWDVVKQAANKNYLGAFGGSINFAGGLMTFVGTAQFNRWVQVRKAMQVAGAVRTAGVVSAGTIAGAPEGLLLIILGSVALAVGEVVLRTSLQPDLLKAVKYGYFGKEPYNGLFTPYDRPKVKEVQDHSVYQEGLFGQKYTRNMDLEVVYEEPEEFDTEMGEIYRCLFDYNSGVAVYKETDRAHRKKTGKSVIKGSIYFSRLLVRKSLVEVELELHYRDRVEIPIIRLPEMRVREEKDGDNLTALHVYYHVDGQPPSYVIMRSMLDIHGDGRFMVPGAGTRAWKENGEKFTKRVVEFKPVYGAMQMIQYPYPIKNATKKSFQDDIMAIDISETSQAHKPVYDEVAE